MAGMTIGWTVQDARNLEGCRIALRDIADVMLAREVDRIEATRPPTVLDGEPTCNTCHTTKRPHVTRYMGDPIDRHTCLDCGAETYADGSMVP